MPIEFDFDGARKSGATDKDISEYFKTKYNIEFDIEGAKKSGAKDADILGYLNTKYSEPLKKKEPTTQGLQFGYKTATEATSSAGLPKQEKLSQSPLKTAVTTTPSVSTKPKWTAEQQKSLIEGIKTGNLAGNTPEESDYLSRIGDRIVRGMNTLNQNLAKTPEFIYNIAAIPQNIIAEKFDVPSLSVSAEKVKKDLGITNAVADYYGEEVKKLAYLDDKYMGANGSVTSLINKGNYKDAAKLLGEQIAESLPTTAAIAASGGLGATSSAITLGGGAVFGAGKYDELADRTDLTESEKTAISLSTGLVEGLIENIGTANLGRVAKEIFAKQGADVAKDEIKKSFVTAYKEGLKKYMPISGVVSEGIEEAGTQFAQNAIDIYGGVDPNKKITDGVMDALLVGMGSGAVISSPTLLSKKRNEQAKNIQADIDQIDSEIQNENISEQAKASLIEARQEKMTALNNVLQEDVDEQKSIPEASKREIEALQEDLDNIDIDIEQVTNDASKKILENKKQQIENRIEQLTTIKDEQGAIEEPINRGVDVLEEGVGMAVEPSKEGIEGEDIQTEALPPSPLEGQTTEVVSETVSEIEPPVVEQTTTDVGGVTTPNVSESLKSVESTAKALEGVSNKKVLPKIKTFSINGLKDFYHASQSKRKGRLRKSNAPQFGTGIYFSSNKDLVKNEFGENVTNAAINLSNPVFTNTPEWSKVTRRAIELADAEYGKNKKLKLPEDESYFRYDPDNLSEIDEIPSNFISDAAQELGYDAIIDEDSSTYENEIVVLDESKIIYDEDIPFFISEAYHQAKADGSNPELVAAVEELLGKPKEAAPKSVSVVGGEIPALKEIGVEIKKDKTSEGFYQVYKDGKFVGLLGATSFEQARNKGQYFDEALMSDILTRMGIEHSKAERNIQGENEFLKIRIKNSKVVEQLLGKPQQKSQATPLPTEAESKAITEPTKQERVAERKVIAEAKIDDLAAKAKEFLRNKNLPEGTKKAGIGQDDIIDILASTVKALVNSGIEISEAIKQVREHFEQDFDTSEIKDFQLKQAIARDELTDFAKENGFSSYREAVFSVNKYVREVGKEDVITKEEITQAKEAKAKEAPTPKKGYTTKKKQAEREDKAGETKQRAFAEFAAERGGIDPNTIPEGIRYYTTTSVEEQAKIAKDLIKKIGLDNAISLLTDSRYKPLVDVKNIPSLAAEVLNSIYELQQNTTDEETLSSYAVVVNKILQETVIAAGNAATLMSMMREFYKSNPYNFVAQITTLIAHNNSALASDILAAINDINDINKNVAAEVAGNVVNKVTSKKVAAAKAKYEKSKSNLKAAWNKGQKLGIAPNPYEQAKNDVEFVKALTAMAKDFVVYQSVKFSEYLKEVSEQLGINESDIDKEHLKGVFDKAKSEKIASGIKLSLKELELKLKDLIQEHYSTDKSIEDSLIEKLKTQFGLSDTDAKEVEDAIKHELKVLTAKEKIKALNAKGIKNKKYIDEIIALSEAGLLNSTEILKSFGTKLGIQELTPEESAKLLAIAKEIQESKEDRIKAKNIQKFEDYKFVLSKRYGVSDFLVSNYLTNIFGSIGANLINIASNVAESILLTAELLTNALAKGSRNDVILVLNALADGGVRGFDFTKEVLKTGVASYKEPYQIHARNMWELIMDREVNLNRMESTLKMLFSTPYIGKALLAERRFWNRALLSMDSLSGTTNMELGALWAATKEANKRGLKGDARANFIAEQMAATPKAKEEAIAYAINLGYKQGTSAFKRAVANYLVSKRPEEIKRAAYEYSGRATLTQEPPLNTITGQMAHLLNTTIAKNQKLKFIFPVVNTFANLIIKNIERSPFEVFSLGLDAVTNKAGLEYNKSGLTKEEVARRLKASAAATAVGVLLFMLAGGMDDDEEGFEVFGSGTGDPLLDSERRALGWKPNTMKFTKDGGYYTFEYLPIGFLLSMVGNMRDYFKYKDEAAIAIRKAQAEKIFGKTLDSLTDEERNTLESELLSGKYNVSEIEQKELGNLAWQVGKTPIQYPAQLFKSLGDLMGVIGDDKTPTQKGISFGANIVRGNLAPRYMGEVRDIFDEKLYDSKEFWNTAGANVPFIELGNVKLDGFGRDIDKYEPKTPWSGVKYALTRRFYNPSRGTQVDQFLWENRIRVSPPNNSASMAYPQEAYRDYIVLRGKLAMEYIQEAINNGGFQYEEDGVIKEYTPMQKAEIINKYLSKANENAAMVIDEKLGRNNITIE